MPLQPTKLETIYILKLKDYIKVSKAISNLNLNERPGNLFEIIGDKFEGIKGYVSISFSGEGKLFKGILIKEKLGFYMVDNYNFVNLFKQYSRGILIKEGDENIIKQWA